jgi:hypothetical protein
VEYFFGLVFFVETVIVVIPSVKVTSRQHGYLTRTYKR